MTDASKEAACSRLLQLTEARTRVMIRLHLERMSYRNKELMGLLPHYPAIPVTRQEQQASISLFAEGLVNKLAGSLQDKQQALATLNALGIYLMKVVPAWQMQQEIRYMLTRMDPDVLLDAGVFGKLYTAQDVEAAYRYHVEQIFKAMTEMAIEGN